MIGRVFIMHGCTSPSVVHSRESRELVALRITTALFRACRHRARGFLGLRCCGVVVVGRGVHRRGGAIGPNAPPPDWRQLVAVQYHISMSGTGALVAPVRHGRQTHAVGAALSSFITDVASVMAGRGIPHRGGTTGYCAPPPDWRQLVAVPYHVPMSSTGALVAPVRHGRQTRTVVV